MATELVLDSSVAIRAGGSAAARELLRPYHLISPPLLWSEVTSAVNEARWRRELTPAQADDVLHGFASMDVSRTRPAGLYATASAIASELGWAKTYDAEFLALARIRRCRTVTGDARMLRGAARTGLVVSVVDLPAP